MDLINEMFADFLELGYTPKEAMQLAWIKYLEMA